VGKTELRQADRRHLVGHERPFAGEAIASCGRLRSRTLGVVGRFEGDQFLREPVLKRCVAVEPGSRVTSADSRREQARCQHAE